MYRVNVLDTDQNVLRTVDTTEKTFTYQFEDNKTDNGGTAARNFTIQVMQLDDSGNLSDPNSISIINPPPPAVAEVKTQVFSDIGMQITPTPPSDHDLAGMLVWLSTEEGFTPDDTTLVYDGNDLNAPVPVDGADTYYFRIALLDTFDRVNYIISDEFSRVVTKGDLTAGLEANSQLIQQVSNSLADKADASALQVLSDTVSNFDGRITANATLLDQVKVTSDGAEVTASEALQASADNTGKLSATYQVTLDSNGYVSGLKAFNDGSTSTFDILTNKFRIINPNSHNMFSPFQVNGNNVIIENAIIKNLISGNFDFNAAVSLGGIEATNQISTVSTVYGDITGLSDFRTFDDDGVALFFLQLFLWSNSSGRKIQAQLKIDGSVVCDPILYHDPTASNHAQSVIGVAAAQVSQGSRLITPQWKVSNATGFCSIRRLICVFLKKASFSGISGNSGGGGSWGGTPGGNPNTP